MNLDPVPKIKNGVTQWSAEGLNPIFSALENNIDKVAEALDNVTGDAGYIFTDTGFSADCKKGMLIAYDRTLDRYVPAAAVWGNEVAPNGGLMAADSAFVVGLLMTDIDTSKNGVILAAGWTTNEEIIDLAVPQKQPGRYYLSVDGKAVPLAADSASPSILPVYCFSYTATGKLILNPKLPEVSGHAHTSYELAPSLWGPASGSAATDLPSSAQYVYNTPEDTELSMLLNAYITGKSLVWGGAELSADQWGITESGYIYLTFTGEAGTKSILHTITPFFGTEPIVRAVGVANGNTVLTSKLLAGTVVLDTKFNTLTITDKSALAVTDISRTGIKKGPVVTSVQPGLGIKIETQEDAEGVAVPGGVVVHSTAVADTLLDMILLNANNVAIGAGPNQASLVFPSGQISSVLLGFRVPMHSVENQRGVIEAWVFGTGAAINTFTASVTVMPEPAADTPIAIPTAQTVNMTPVSSTDTTHIYQMQSADFGPLPGNALVYVELTASSPAASTAIASIGIKLQ